LPSYRSSVTNRLAGLTDIGGVNSIRSFTRSWQRAAGFAEVIPQRPSFVYAPDQAPLGLPAEGLPARRIDVEAPDHSTVRSSLLRQHFEAPSPSEGLAPEESPVPESSHAANLQPGDFREREQKAFDNDLSQLFRVGSAATTSGSIFAVPPHLATPEIIGSYGTMADYGTVRSNVSRVSMAQAAAHWQQQQEVGGNVPDGEIVPILVKEVEQDGKIVLAVEGQSTLPQTVFNSIKYVPVLPHCAG